MITRKNPLLDTFIDVENGGEGVDTAIRKLDKEFDNVIEGTNATQTELDGVKKKVTELDEINHGDFALKSEIPEIVGSRTINVEVAGRENKISVNLTLASAQNPDPGLMTQSDKIILENLRNAGETLASHVVNEDIHVPEWVVPQDIGKVLKLTESGTEWSMGMGPGEFEGVFSVNGQQGPLILEGEGQTEIRTEAKGKFKISTPLIKEATSEKSGLMSASDKGKLTSIPSIPIPKEEDKGKALVYKEDGSLSWETQATHYIGEIFAYAGGTPPTGAVECKGQAMSKKAYPDLFAVLEYSFGGSDDTFLLPDTYSAGRFLRSRSTIVPIGTEQEDAMQPIKYEMAGNINGSGQLLFSGTSFTSGPLKVEQIHTPRTPNATGALTQGWANLYFDTSTDHSLRTADENRPVNVSVMYCIQITHGYTAPTIMAMDKIAKEIEELKNTMKTHYIGEIFAYAGTTPPMGAVECRGQVMSKSAYPDLFEVIDYNFGGSGDLFHLPDTYSAGRFLRSRSGTVSIGTKQGDAIKTHTHTLPETIMIGQKSYSAINDGIAGGGAYGKVGTLRDTGSGFNTSYSGESENRPINVSVMYCIQIAHRYTNLAQVDVSTLQNEVVKLRNEVQYSPMFIEGFDIQYVSRNLVRIRAGHCRDASNTRNIDFTNPSGYALTITGYTSWAGIFIFCVVKSDGKLTFKHKDKNSYVLEEDEIAYRRIGSLSWETTSGIVPYKSSVRGSELVIRYINLWANLSWRGAAVAPFTPVFTFTVPNINCTAYGYSYLEATDANAWPFVSVSKSISGTLLLILSNGGGQGTQFRESFEVPITPDDSVMKLSIQTQPNLRAYIDIQTYGYADWRNN